MIGEKVDATLDPHRRRQVSGKLNERGVLSIPAAIHPERARGAAAIPFPARWISRVAAHHHSRTVWIIGNRTSRADLDLRRLSSIERNREKVERLPERLTPVARCEHRFSVGVPSRHLGDRSEPGEPFRSPAVGRHDVDLVRAVISTRECELRPVRRERRKRDDSRIGGQAARRSSLGRNRPEIVLADEHDGVAVNRRVSIVTSIGSHLGTSPMVTLLRLGRFRFVTEWWGCRRRTRPTGYCGTGPFVICG